MLDIDTRDEINEWIDNHKKYGHTGSFALCNRARLLLQRILDKEQ